MDYVEHHYYNIKRNLIDRSRIARFLRRHNLMKPSLIQRPKAMYRHVLAADIIGLSRPILTEEEQTRKIEILSKSLSECEIFTKIQKENIFFKLTGDGFLIGISEDITFPIDLAIQIHEKLEKYNQHLDNVHQVKIRIGIHSGTSSPVEALVKDEWGEAYIGATRIMNIGESDHILLSSKTALELIHLSTRYEQILHHIGEYMVKHNVVYSIYSAIDHNFGNFNSPPKTIEEKLLHTSEYPESNYLTEDEFENFTWGLFRLDPFCDNPIEEAPMSREAFGIMFMLMRECNLKVSDVLDLTKQDFDLEHGSIEIKNGKSNRVKKTGVSSKVIPLLKAYTEDLAEDDLLFPTSSEVVLQYAKDAGRLAGLSMFEE